MSETLNRLMRISELAELLARIFMYLLVAVIILAVILTVLVALNPDLIPYIAENIEGTDVATNDFLAMSVACITGGVIGVVTLYYVRSLFSNIHKSGTPFTDESVETLVLIAILVVVGTIALPVITAVSSYAFGVWPNHAMDFNPFMLFVAFLLYFLSLIFKYGTALQRESDEML